MTVYTPNRQGAEAEERFCGEIGHMAGKCKNLENQHKVIQKLIQALRRAKTNSPHLLVVPPHKKLIAQ